MEDGDCYPNAYNLLMQLNDMGLTNSALVHGKLTNKDGSIIDHAWVEVADRVFDPSIDPENPMQVIRGQYCEVGKVTNTKKYFYDEALENFIILGNYGPWV